MDDNTRLHDEFNFASSTESASYNGAFFPNSRQFVVKGGTFTSNNSIASQPPDYLRLPLGSIDLLNEISLDAAVGAVWRNSGRGTVRRTYSARVECRSAPMTVTLYEGDDAEEVNGGRVFLSIQACDIPTLFSFTPLRVLVESMQQYSMVYICVYTCADQAEALLYSLPLMRTDAFVRNHGGFTMVRRSTARLCGEFGSIIRLPLLHKIARLPPPSDIQILHDAKQETRVIASLALDEWYYLCDEALGQSRETDVSVEAEMKIGSIIHRGAGGQFGDSTEIAWAMLIHT
ncbi:hypothetical protein MSAN_00473300 [Mycena sanguinolenta]|uniref:Uncharacterized protein n=1 Tax=Mycena sanguinolenta TaxID=230812 RepID=A0A8H7DHQ0_9AGAR|nr:hypothetical protein MSAN_00473300 [Mycena sanguinolenta]